MHMQQQNIMAESLSEPSVSFSLSSTDSDSDSVEISGSRISTDKQVDVPSLLDRLKSPAPSELSRKRKTRRNPAKEKRSKGAVAAEPVPTTRIREFPNQNLSIVSSKLFCIAYRENLSMKKSVIIQHIKSSKHINGKERLEKNELRERNISDMLKQYDKKKHLIGETLSDETMQSVSYNSC